MSHTPGPWRAVEFGETGVYHIKYNDHGNWLAEVYPGDDTPEDRAETKADAALIAAAPELLAVMQEMFCDGPVQIAMAGNPVVIEALEKRAREAIAKAMMTEREKT